MTWLLDTNVLSELRKPKPEAAVVRFVAAQSLDLLYVSVVTFAEIRFGIELVKDVARRMELNDWLEHKLRPMFEDRVLEISEDVMLKWRLLVEEGRKKGHTFSQPDLIIAATALHYGLTIVSRDTKEYEMANAAGLNPWTRRLEGRAVCVTINRRRTSWPKAEALPKKKRKSRRKIRRSSECFDSRLIGFLFDHGSRTIVRLSSH